MAVSYQKEAIGNNRVSAYNVAPIDDVVRTYDFLWHYALCGEKINNRIIHILIFIFPCIFDVSDVYIPPII